MNNDIQNSFRPVLLDVVTITCKVDATLLNTLQSVSNQSYEAINHIVIYQESQDLNLEKLQVFNHQKRLLFYPQKGQGISSAFNSGINRSQGELTLFLNSGDTLVSPNVIERVVNDYRQHQWLWATGETISLSKNKFIKRYRRQHKSWRDSLFFYGNPICHQSTLYSRKLIKKSGLYNESLSLGMDYEYNLRANKFSNPRLLYFPIAYYDTTGVSSIKVFKQFFSHRNIRDRYFELPWLKQIQVDLYCFTKALYRLAMVPAKLWL